MTYISTLFNFQLNLLSLHDYIPTSHSAQWIFKPYYFEQFLQVSKKPIVIYPNSGERYDAEQKQWVVRLLSFAALVQILLLHVQLLFFNEVLSVKIFLNKILSYLRRGLKLYLLFTNFQKYWLCLWLMQLCVLSKWQETFKYRFQIPVHYFIGKTSILTYLILYCNEGEIQIHQISTTIFFLS